MNDPEALSKQYERASRLHLWSFAAAGAWTFLSLLMWRDSSSVGVIALWTVVAAAAWAWVWRCNRHESVLREKVTRALNERARAEFLRN